jgi:hypothetical protein
MSHDANPKCLALRITGVLRRWLNRLVLRQSHDNCHRCAEQICTIGQQWDADTQHHLNSAKDHLYRAARRFEEGRAWKSLNVRREQPRPNNPEG